VAVKKGRFGLLFPSSFKVNLKGYNAVTAVNDVNDVKKGFLTLMTLMTAFIYWGLE